MESHEVATYCVEDFFWVFVHPESGGDPNCLDSLGFPVGKGVGVFTVQVMPDEYKLDLRACLARGDWLKFGRAVRFGEEGGRRVNVLSKKPQRICDRI